ncbi:sigma-70 family RNA polymerase sigma factor [Candidatus Nomurabacteria bacterium]|nr:sigma-70 family RNA polymerase sigma factor [Candidatus Nomurabacteria bacterium]
MRQLKITQMITSKESASLDKYLADISKIDLLTADEEIELAQRIKDGDEVAEEKLTKANLRFVVTVAKQYQFKGLSLGDLINEGNLGLIKAVKRFDETRGFKFISYALWWIRQSIITAINDTGRMVRLPANRIGEYNKVMRVNAQLEQKIGKEPTFEELAEALKDSGINTENVEDILNSSIKTFSIDTPFNETEETNFLSFLENTSSPTPDKKLNDESLCHEINNVLKTLTEREAQIIRMYFGIETDHTMTLEEIGEMYNLTRERVRQIKEKALRRLRHISRSKKLRDYLG